MILKELYRNSVSCVQSGHDFAQEAHSHFDLIKSSSAYHEAGHAIALHHHGCKVGVTYCVGIRYWNKSHIWAQTRFQRAQFAKLSRDARLKVYFAGVAAEVLAFNLLEDDLLTCEVRILRRRLAIGAQDDLLKAVSVHLNSQSKNDIWDFIADEISFLNFFGYQASRTLNLLAPHKALMHSFAKKLAEWPIVVRSSTFLESMIVEQ